jgi:hypothetical protein
MAKPRKQPKPARKPARPRVRLPRAKPIPALGPLKFGPEVRGRILEALKLGATQKLAAEFAGVDPRTVKTWLAKGRDNLAELAAWETDGEQGPEPRLDVFGRFVLEVGQARAAADFTLVGAITEAAKRGEWRAALALLARRRPAEFGEHLAVSAVSGPDDDGERRDVTDDLLSRLTTAARRVRGETAE